MDYSIRQMRPEEYPLLKDFLYEAIFQKKGQKKLPKSSIHNDALKIYIQDFGNENDTCLCAEQGGRVIGAAWARVIPGYGSVDNRTPELAVSLYPDCRRKGIGTELIKRILENLKEKGYAAVSLSVQGENPAFELYKRLGFEIRKKKEEEYIMVYSFH
jgi:ribosomal protein S18 acetylase RimI-like enzyme